MTEISGIPAYNPLKKLYAEAQLSADLLKEAMAKKW